MFRWESHRHIVCKLVTKGGLVYPSRGKWQGEKFCIKAEQGIHRCGLSAMMLNGPENVSKTCVNGALVEPKLCKGSAEKVLFERGHTFGRQIQIYQKPLGWTRPRQQKQTKSTTRNWWFHTVAFKPQRPPCWHPGAKCERDAGSRVQEKVWKIDRNK